MKYVLNARWTRQPPSLPRIAIVLALIGAALAGPSYLLAFAEADQLAMLLGMAFYYVLLLGVSQTHFAQDKLRDRAVTLSIVTALVVRVLGIPCLGIIDLMAGAFSIGIAGINAGYLEPWTNVTFKGTLLATLTEGIFLILEFVLLVAIVFPIHIRRLAKTDHSGLCPGCGYDLRATTERCPECGAPVPAGHQPTATLLGGD